MSISTYLTCNFTYCIIFSSSNEIRTRILMKSQLVKNKEGNYSYSMVLTVEQWEQILKIITINTHRIQLQDKDVNRKVPIQLEAK
ncbi:hypothetical protein [Brevibacillus laterosporus]|uniref:hypothetical protein n=1 Tax=Brevibacillus laterosporus TaxID=1465 RepID=UPI000CE5407D|nr:hypothetical protein [Brevibacillus laterosporus]MED1667048.1 hypothetical protein [Brevibacillus laterosporus]MED1671760.1 hypothetical protein [Brevibacillus laterosporus]MED1721089.1 hypothetical protein [Brevibacillus laterosporus]PPA80796.1 hypothetical protein C4A76_25315 [Brevibacillus laterosporus]